MSSSKNTENQNRQASLELEHDKNEPKCVTILVKKRKKTLSWLNFYVFILFDSLICESNR